MKFKKTLLSMATVFSLMLGLSACGDDPEQLKKAASIIAAHYDRNPPNRGWQVLSVVPDTKDNRLLVQILVTNDKDVHRLKSLSRMDQLHVAKLSCPLMFDELQSQLGSDTRVWVELRASNKTLITSICPH